MGSSWRDSAIAKLRTAAEAGIPLRDGLFDTLLDQDAFDAASTHWTPAAAVPVVRHMLAVGEASRILDVGSGSGKFCILAALTGPGHFTGVELRPWLHRQALQLKHELQAHGADFVQGDMAHLPWSAFTGFYLYNPFYENLLLEEPDADQRVVRHDQPFSRERFRTFVATVEARLAATPSGTRVVTFHGFGGSLDPWFDRAEAEAMGRGELELWIRR